MPAYDSHGMVVLRPLVAAALIMSPHDLKRPMNSSLLAWLIQVPSAGVRLEGTTRPPVNFISQLPPNSPDWMRWPRSPIGVWQMKQPPRGDQYLSLPRASLAASCVTTLPA